MFLVLMNSGNTFPNLTSPFLLPQSVSVQPTLQHFIRKTKSDRPITTRDDRGELSQEEERENIQSIDDGNVKLMCESPDTCLETAPADTEIKMSGCPQQELKNCLDRVSRAEEKKGSMINARNPFAVRHRGVHVTRTAENSVRAKQGSLSGETGREKKVLSLKRRKRKLPASATAKVGGDPTEAKAFRTARGRGRVDGQVRDNRASSKALAPEGLSSDDLTLLLGYSTPVDESTRLSLHDLEQFESSKQRTSPQAAGRGLHTTTSPSTPKRSSLKW